MQLEALLVLVDVLVEIADVEQPGRVDGLTTDNGNTSGLHQVANFGRAHRKVSCSLLDANQSGLQKGRRGLHGLTCLRVEVHCASRAGCSRAKDPVMMAMASAVWLPNKLQLLVRSPLASSCGHCGDFCGHHPSRTVEPSGTYQRGRLR